jgi:hypothetical protein
MMQALSTSETSIYLETKWRYIYRLYIASDDKIISEQRIGKDMLGSSRGII